MSQLTIFIPTWNEAKHISRAVASAKRLTDRVWIVDSFSQDRTKELATEAGALVVENGSTPFSAKLNWAIANLPIKTPWVMRLDADEVVTDEMAARLPRELLGLSADVCGVYVRRQLWFMGKWMRHGGMYPTWSMRIWRHGCAVCESRNLDEHMLLTRGSAQWLPLDLVDDPLIDLTTWISKHNHYSTLEASSAASSYGGVDLIRPKIVGTPIERTRWLKVHVFSRLPYFLRAFFYFVFRYIVRGGFLDGRKGFIFHVLHGFWYRFLVDAKIYEIQQVARCSQPLDSLPPCARSESEA